MNRLILIFFLFILAGCGSGKNTSYSNNTKIRGILFDSQISGVEYNCGPIKGITTKNGEFLCPINSTVTFTIGGVLLGSFVENNTTLYLTPAKLYGLKYNNITDNRIINFIRLVQSLDSDNNASNGIDIDATTREALKNVNLNISNANTTQSDLNKIVSMAGETLVAQDEALIHYINVLKNVLSVIFTNEPYYYQQWYLAKNSTFYDENKIEKDANIHVNDLLRVYTGKGVKIAVIDNGLDITHEDLKNAIIDTYSVITNSANVSHTNANGYHGTAVTGIIAARRNGKGIQGIASQSQVIFLQYKENMSDSETVELFNKAEKFGADIINCSWGTYDVSQSVKDKIVDLAKNGRNGKGTIIVFACGNDDKDMGNDESAIPEVISVGATNKDNLRTWYSNYGKYLDIVAPGGYDVGITTLDPMYSNGIASIVDNYLLYNDSNSFIGTSASAPIISGVVALMLEKNPNLTRVEVEKILENSSDKIGSLQYENGRNDYYGYGKVNVNQIMHMLNL